MAFKWFLPLIKEFGGTHPPDDRIRREITTLSIGDGKGATQHFNKFPDGNCISRGAGGVQVTGRKCIFIKHSAFGKESWRTFSEGTFPVLNFLFNFSFHNGQFALKQKNNKIVAILE